MIINGYIVKSFNINVEFSEEELRDLLLEMEDVLKKLNEEGEYINIKKLCIGIYHWLEINKENSLL